jgi:hypothetical protein
MEYLQLMLAQIEQDIANNEWNTDMQILNNYLKRFGINESLYID